MPARPEPPAEPAALRWTVHPAAEQRLRTLAVVAAIGLAAALVLSVSGSGAGAAVAALLLAGSLRAWFLPRTYVLDGSGASEAGPLQAERRLPWAEVRTVTRERHGVHLSPLREPSRWVPDRGLFLRTGEQTGLAERAEAVVRERTAG